MYKIEEDIRIIINLNTGSVSVSEKDIVRNGEKRREVKDIYRDGEKVIVDFSQKRMTAEQLSENIKNNGWWVENN